MTGRIAGAATAFFLVLVATVFAAEDKEKAAFYRACGEPDPGARARAMIDFLEIHPDGPWSDRVRTLFFGVTASGGWKESAERPAEGALRNALEREAAVYLAGGDGDPDRLLVVAEAFLRAGVKTEDARALALRAGALADEAERPADMPLRTWGRTKRERKARSDYLVGLADLLSGDPEGAARSFRLAENVFASDGRFREEYAAALAAAGRPGTAPDDLLDERSAAMDAIGTANEAERIEKYERYLLLYPDGDKATEIAVRLVEDYLNTPSPNRGVALATRVASETEDPEVLSALCLLLARAGSGTAEAVRMGERAKETLLEWIRDPRTEASSLPDLNSALLMVRDAYGWALFRAGRIDEAIEELRAASGSEMPPVLHRYGAALLETGRTLDAMVPLVRARAGGVEEAAPLLDRIRESDWALAEEVDEMIDKEEASLRRKALAVRAPRPAPAFSLVSVDGKTVRLEDLRGAPAVIVFWATWCEPCRDMLPHLQSAAEEYRGKEVRFLTVNTDRDFWLVRPFLEDEKIRVPTLLTAGETDWEDTARDFRLSALPAIYWIDREGRIRFETEEYDGNANAFRNILRWRIDELLQ